MFLTPDDVTREGTDCWRDIYGLNDADVAALIRHDAIDILVDLGGHTNPRLLVFGRRPAPVQETYLAYPDTTGLPAIDYRITDRWADPPGYTEHLNTEHLVRLPYGFLCYQPPSDSPRVAPPPAPRTGRITFGSFNALPKMTPRVVGVWSSVLHSVPESYLLLKASA